MTLDIDHLRRWIGREDRDAEILTPTLARQFNATFDRTSGTAPGDDASLMLHYCLAQPILPTRELGPDGHEARGEFLPPVPLPRRMWAGGAIAFHGAAVIGETVSRASTIRNVEMKQGRSGALCFVTVDHTVESDGRPVLSERQDIVYRGAPQVGSGAGVSSSASSGAEKAAPPPAPIGTYRRQITPSAPLLFRYSAMTFNGHRIHYDAPYVRDVEGYPGLIVHGPMQSTLLCQFAADLRGACPARFAFRSLTPIFDTCDFTLNAEETATGLKLWTAAQDGPVAMEATADW
ncbi:MULTISPECIES: FAS1-like dehydratase domain-containing protein [unclassified Marinovum]